MVNSIGKKGDENFKYILHIQIHKLSANWKLVFWKIRKRLTQYNSIMPSTCPIMKSFKFCSVESEENVFGDEQRNNQTNKVNQSYLFYSDDIMILECFSHNISIYNCTWMTICTPNHLDLHNYRRSIKLVKSVKPCT